MNKDEKEYLNMIHSIHQKHGIQTKIFSLQPFAVKFELFHGHCEFCDLVLHSRPMYIMKIPGNDMYQIKYLCQYCAGLHEKYIKFMIISKN